MRIFYPLILAGICWSLPVGAVVIPDCAGRTEISHAHVVRVEKNGALILSDGRAVLLEGVRLPLADHDAAAMTDEALNQLRSLALARPLTLTSTPPKEDRYDRVRVQAFGTGWLQMELLQRGLARVQISPDRSECAPDFYETEQAARAAGRGLWAFAAYGVRKPDAGLLRDAGSFQLVEGSVTNAASHDGRIYLDFGHGFSAIVAPEDTRAFRDLDPPREALVGRRIRIRGIVELDGGRAVIALSNPAQIELLP